MPHEAQPAGVDKCMQHATGNGGAISTSLKRSITASSLSEQCPSWERCYPSRFLFSLPRYYPYWCIASLPPFSFTRNICSTKIICAILWHLLLPVVACLLECLLPDHLEMFTETHRGKIRIRQKASLFNLFLLPTQNAGISLSSQHCS